MTDAWEEERQKWLTMERGGRERLFVPETRWEKLAARFGLFKRLTDTNQELRAKLAEMDRQCQVAGRYGLAVIGQEDLIARIQSFVGEGKDGAGQYLAYIRSQKLNDNHAKLTAERDAWKRAYEQVCEDWNTFVEPRYKDAPPWPVSKLDLDPNA